jgi:hypothetical protein
MLKHHHIKDEQQACWWPQLRDSFSPHRHGNDQQMDYIFRNRYNFLYKQYLQERVVHVHLNMYLLSVLFNINSIRMRIKHEEQIFSPCPSVIALRSWKQTIGLTLKCRKYTSSLSRHIVIAYFLQNKSVSNHNLRVSPPPRHYSPYLSLVLPCTEVS